MMMAKVDQFLDQLINYNKEDIHPDIIKAIQPYLENPEFNPDFIRSKSVAAAGIVLLECENYLWLNKKSVTYCLIIDFSWTETNLLFPFVPAWPKFNVPGLCSWVINIIRFYEVYCDVEPKRRALEEANAELAAAQNRLTSITSKIKVGRVGVYFSLYYLGLKKF